MESNLIEYQLWITLTLFFFFLFSFFFFFALGVYLSDLTFLEDGNPDRVDGNLINFWKLTRVANLVQVCDWAHTSNSTKYKYSLYIETDTNQSIRKFNNSKQNLIPL